MTRDARVERYTKGIREVEALLAERRPDQASAVCERLAVLRPEAIEPLLLLSRVRQQQGRFDDMRQLVEQALQMQPARRGAQLQYAEACLFCGQHDKALQVLATLEQQARNDPGLLQHVAEFYAHVGKHADAYRCHTNAVELDPDNPQYRYNLASSQVAMGDVEAAERSYTAVIDANPLDYDAWHSRSTLRKQTDEDNHIAELNRLLDTLQPGSVGEVPLCYALAKEYEDLGDYTVAYEYLQRGADARRCRMAYRVDGDVAVMSRIVELFDAAFFESSRKARDRTGPIFVMGLPRSGTTLVDRILSGHSQVESMGEINDFALTLTRLGGTVDKYRLLDVSVGLDMDALGDSYIKSVRRYGTESPRFIDKTPANYLYIGLIARALPAAKIVHVRRHPVDSCLAMYRTLFRMGYPFSYDLGDLTRYYLAYDELMRHWRDTLPGLIFDVSYEQLVDDIETVSWEVVEHCGLDWEDGLLAFDKNQAPVATASAAQVRRPLYRDALHRWRRYERQLQPLIAGLREAGVDV